MFKYIAVQAAFIACHMTCVSITKLTTAKDKHILCEVMQ